MGSRREPNEMARTVITCTIPCLIHWNIHWNKTGHSVGNNLSSTVLYNLQLTADFAGLLISDNQPREETKHNERGCMDKINF